MKAERGRKLAGALSALCCVLALAITMIPVAPMGDGAASRRAQEKPALEELDSFDAADDDESAAERYSRMLEGADIQADQPDARLFDAPGASAGIAPEREWTFLVYMVGSNLESQFGAATDDFREIEAADIDYGRANVVAYAGGSKRWNVDIPNDRNSVLDFSRAEGERIVAQTDGSANMGAPATLSSFVNWACERYPARHFALVLWDHGGGPLWGYGVDELNGGDTLLLSEMREAMSATPFGSQRKLDLVGFDACLMGSVENALLWADFADALVASEEVEAGAGWDYSFLDGIASAPDGRELANSIVDSYGSYYESHRTALSNPDYTLAACDLTCAADMERALESFAHALSEEVDQGRYAALNRIRARAKSFGLSAAPTRDEAYDLVDIGDVAQRLGDRHEAESRQMLEALDDFVIGEASNVERANGLSIYFPGENRELYQEVGEELGGGAGEAFAEFSRDYASAWLKAADVDWKLAKPKLSDDGSEYLLELTDEQAASLRDAEFTVLASGFEGSEYRLLAERLTAEVDDDGTVRMPADPRVVAGVSRDVALGDESAVPWRVEQMSRQGSRIQFKAKNTRLSPMWDPYDPYGMTGNLDIAIEADAKSSAATIKSFVPAPGVGELAGRASIDTASYVSIMNSYQEQLSLTRDSKGAILPCSQWDGTSSTSWSMLPLDGFHFELRDVSQCCNVPAFGQLCVVDVNGDLHACELVDLGGKGEDYRDVELKTERGVLTMRVFDDHAAAVTYRGKDEAIQIPAEVESRPVTEVWQLWPDSESVKNTTVKRITVPGSVKRLGAEAFRSMMALEDLRLPDGLEHIGREAISGCSALVHLDIPASVKSIGSGAFSSSAIERLEIPSSLEHVADGAFAYLSHLTEFEQDGPNAATSVRDGVLFSADGKTLLAFPATRTGDYAVPDGVEVIGCNAFGGAKLSSLSLPDGLLRIEPYALGIDGDREGIGLPASVRHIATRAFGDLFLRDSGGDQAGVLAIGPDVSFIGDGAFDGLNVSAFQVDEDNAAFSSAGGFLTNKAGDTILEVPQGIGNPIVVPDGITTILAGTFGDSQFKSRDFVFPNSAFRISARAFPYEAKNASTFVEGEAEGELAYVYDATFHCEEGSAAEAFAQIHDIAYDGITDVGALRFETVELEQDGTAFTAHVYGDHAVIADYHDAVSDTHPDRVVFPSEVQGVPVTAIGARRFGDGSTAKLVVIPAAVETATAQDFAPSLFAERFEVEEGSERFSSVDGVLFAEDGAELVAYPREAKRDAYQVPEGTEAIGDHAFADSDVVRVDVPESVERIGSYAFASYRLERVGLADGLAEIGDYAFARSGLKDISLPDSIERIGDRAFELASNAPRADVSRGFKLPRDLTFIGEYAFGFVGEVAEPGGGELLIGSELTHIGHGALEGLEVSSYRVDSENPQFESTGPLLIDKQARAVIACAPGAKGEVRVPDGIVEIDYGALGRAGGITDLHLPDSLERVSGAFNSAKFGSWIAARIHCSAGTMAARYAQEQGLDVVLE